MQLLGLTAMDLLNPANLSALYCEVTGNASDPQALVLNADFTALFNDMAEVASENDAQLDLLSQLTASDDGEILDADIVSSADTTNTTESTGSVNTPEKTVDSSYDDTAASGQNINDTADEAVKVYDGSTQKVTLTDEFGEIEVYLLPFVRPSIVRRALGQEEIESYQDAVFAAVNHMDIDTKKRNILVAHQFVTGAGRCDSEDIVVGGVDNIDASIFEAFDYTALGHIHSPQNIKENVRYCGTLLKYSVSEAGQEKSVTVIEMGKKNDIVIRTIPLIPKHDLRAIHGSYMEVTARTFYQGTATDDYVQITLTDEEDIPDGMQKLRTIYPNLLGLSYDNLRTRTQQTIDFDNKIKQKSEKQLFEELYEKQNNQPMSIEQKQFVTELFTRLQEDKS